MEDKLLFSIKIFKREREKMIDVIVVLVYFAFLIAIGFLFQKFNSDTSDFLEAEEKCYGGWLELQHL